MERFDESGGDAHCDTSGVKGMAIRRPVPAPALYRGQEVVTPSVREVYLVNEEPAIAEAVAAIAAQHGSEVLAFSSVADFVGGFRGDPPGCLLVDLDLLCYGDVKRHLLTEGSHLPVIGLAGQADVAMAVSILKQGAFSLLKKPCVTAELRKSIEEALEHDAQQRPRRAEAQETLQRYATLNDDERQVFNLLVAGHANKMIAAQLQIGLRTVELRRATVLRKLQAGSIAELVRMAIAMGLQ
jgi:FixJ family two-component response regulator